MDRPTLVRSAQRRVVSYFPQKALGLFLAANYDLASIRSSFGPRRTPVLRTFADFGMKPSTATENALILDESGGWLYALKIVGRRDVNRFALKMVEVDSSTERGGLRAAR